MSPAQQKQTMIFSTRVSTMSHHGGRGPGSNKREHRRILSSLCIQYPFTCSAMKSLLGQRLSFQSRGMLWSLSKGWMEDKNIWIVGGNTVLAPSSESTTGGQANHSGSPSVTRRGHSTGAHSRVRL